MRKILPLFFLLVLIGLFIYVIHLGLFKPVDTQTKSVGPLHLIYKNHVGPYHKIESDLTEVENWARAKNLNCQKTFAEFLDNPDVVEEVRLRSRVGCVLQELPESHPDDFETMTLPLRVYVVAHFEGAPALGPWKVYRKVFDEFDAKKWPRSSSVIEIYEWSSTHELITEYLFPSPR